MHFRHSEVSRRDVAFFTLPHLTKSAWPKKHGIIALGLFGVFLKLLANDPQNAPHTAESDRTASRQPDGSRKGECHINV